MWLVHGVGDSHSVSDATNVVAHFDANQMLFSLNNLEKWMVFFFGGFV